ncbi:tannase/feruloyl esterase family alpha/beta hydrolase [Marinomonas mediterranea]|uniref:tannase/feruloyl esterase family alpha/beta hydrolase n=1 Tax=Marinomonas mediterranea TaxID=119864 RepID=UPI00234BB66E|nr:tannase/feruloyl esterase family alpha/beta hydrolase [Marinomonas mediterranea]WCN13224.1 tannase/feruloyl esterase family alpha/beta hydrolase [Marinomonas mediterranea]
MKPILLLNTSFALFLTASLGQAAEMDCQSLPNSISNNVDITTKYISNDDVVNVPYCLVLGELDKRTGVDGKYYSLKFELRLPENWKKRFAFQFNGGNDGAVKPALGVVAGLTPDQYPINQGFAVVSSDAGHNGKSNPNAGLVGGAIFGHDPQARQDYGYSFIEKLNPAARQLVESYYKQPIQYAYGIGKSNGGRQAMVSAVRYPNMFDGLLIGYPGFNLPKAAVQHAWDIQALHAVNSDISQALTRQDLNSFSDAILEQCDTLDGAQDGLIFASDECQKLFNPQALSCATDSRQGCLPEEKINALVLMHQGPSNSKHEALYSDWVYDSGIRSGGWRFWKVESHIKSWDHQPIIGVMGAASLAHIFSTPPVNVGGDPKSLIDFLLAYDFDEDAPKIYNKTKMFPLSAMNVMTPPNADNPILKEFQQSNGKMMIYHGNSDPVFSVKDTVRWYNRLDENNDGNASNFAKLYRIPGMPHGQGGPSADQFNMLEPLISWVEQGHSPAEVVAATRDDNRDIPETMKGISRPLCPYPLTAIYKKGDVAKARSFACQ